MSAELIEVIFNGLCGLAELALDSASESRATPPSDTPVKPVDQAASAPEE